MIAGASFTGSSFPFSPGLRVGEWVFVSGQASVSDAGTIVGDTFEGEMRRSLDNLESVLSGAGLGLANVIQVRAYVDDPEDIPDYNRLYREYFTDPLPARTTLTGCLGGKLKFEIDAIAFVDPVR